MNFRVLWLTENYFPSRGGMAQSCDRIVHGLRRKGVEVDVVHFSARKKPYHWQQQQGGRYLACPLEEGSAHTLNRLWTFLEAQDLSYTHLLAFGGQLPVLAASVFPTWMQVPLITLFRGNDLDAALFSARRQGVLLRVLRQSQAVGAVSRDKVKKIRRLCPEAKVFFTPNGIDTDDWALSPSDRQSAAAWKQEHADGRKVVGFFGHLKSKKGVPFFLEALERSGADAQVHLLMVGQMDSELQDMLFHHPRLSHSCLPFMDRYELLGYYPACDAIAIPSFYDGMPNVMLEAGALGIPLITSRVDGMKDLLDEEALGWLFHTGDVADAARAIKAWVTATEEEVQQRTQRCQQLIRESYKQERETANYLEMLVKTLQR
jgi:glycosyltransferase involved in cell wall biosynthesis